MDNKINFDYLKQNILTQTNINKEWFTAYLLMFEDDLILFSSYNEAIRVNPYLVRIRIYYKDLITTDRAKKASILRKVNKYKICGKREWNYLKK